MGPFNVSDIPWETRSLLYFHGTGRQRDKPLRTSTVWLWILIIEAWCQHMTNSLYVLLSRLQHFNVFWRLLDVSKQRNGFLSLENQIKCIWRKDETKLQSDFAFSAHLKEYAWKGWNVWSACSQTMSDCFLLATTSTSLLQDLRRAPDKRFSWQSRCQTPVRLMSSLRRTVTLLSANSSIQIELFWCTTLLQAQWSKICNISTPVGNNTHTLR